MKNVFFTLAVSLITMSLYGQPEPPPDPTPLPGIAWLIAAGAAFGAKKVYDKQKV
jgi:hypothetical protein